MATVAGTTGVDNTTAGDHANTVTPELGSLIVCVCHTSGIAGGTTAVGDNNSGGAGTYVQAAAEVTSGLNTDRLSMWIRTALIASATSTIFTATQAGSNGGGIRVIRISGMTRAGLSAVRSVGSQGSQGSGTTPAPVLSLTPLTANLILTAVRNGTNPAGITQRAGYTEILDTGYNTPASGIEYAHLNSGETSATLTHGGTSPSAFASFAIELDISAAATGKGLPFRARMRNALYRR